MSIENFIDSLAAGNKLEAEEAFNSEMSSRISDALDAKRTEIGQSLYNGSESEE